MKGSGMLLLAAIMLLFGAFSTMLGTAMAFDVGTPGSSATYGSAFCLLGLGLIIAIPGGVLLATTVRAQRRQRQEAVEAKVIEAALKREGRVTAAEVAMVTDLSLVEAQAYLEKMARAGVIAVEVGANGTLIYHFSKAP